MGDACGVRFVCSDVWLRRLCCRCLSKTFDLFALQLQFALCMCVCVCVWALNKTNADAVDAAEVHVASGKRHVEGATWNVVRGTWHMLVDCIDWPQQWSRLITVIVAPFALICIRTEAEGARVRPSPVYSMPAACHTPHMPRENFGRVISITVETIAPWKVRRGKWSVFPFRFPFARLEQRAMKFM